MFWVSPCESNQCYSREKYIYIYILQLSNDFLAITSYTCSIFLITSNYCNVCLLLINCWAICIMQYKYLPYSPSFVFLISKESAKQSQKYSFLLSKHCTDLTRKPAPKICYHAIISHLDGHLRHCWNIREYHMSLIIS